MTRVSTSGNYQSALLDLMQARVRADEANKRVSTQKNATDLTGFGRQSETLTAMKSSQSRIQGFVDANTALAMRLESQDMSMMRIGEGVQAARQAIADALAGDRLDGLMQQIGLQFQVAIGGLNGSHQGRYLFGGGQVEQPPVSVDSLADLAAAPSAASVFRNDSLKASSRLDDGAAIQTGFLADELGEELMAIFRDIQLYQQGAAVTTDTANGPAVFTPAGAGTVTGGKPGEDVTAFLTAQMWRFDRAYEKVTTQTALNGGLQNRVEAVLKNQSDQQIALEEMVGEKTDADLAKALTELELAQIAIQASAHVVNGLRQTSLLDVLR